MGKKPIRAVLLALLAAGAFLGASMLLGYLPLTDTTWGSLVSELILAAMGALGLLALGKGRVLTARGRGFTAGVVAGWILFGYLALVLAATLALWDSEPVSSLDALAFLALMGAIGLAEELTFRGVVQNLLADAFGRDTRRGVWCTVIVSGLIFGLAHVSNLLAGAAPLGVAMQAAAAMALGMYMGAVYARCGNIWPLVLLHGFNDMVALLSAGALTAGGEEGAALTAVSAYGPEKLAAVGLYLALTAFLLRPNKLDRILET